MPEFFDAADAIWMPGRDGIKVGRNYQEQQNLRPWGRHLEGVAGFTKVNTGPYPFYEYEEPDVSGDDGYGYVDRQQFVTSAGADFVTSGGDNLMVIDDITFQAAENFAYIGGYDPGPSPDLLVHSDTVNGDTTFTDSSPSVNTLTGSGTAQHTTAQKKFGATSMYTPATYDRVILPASVLAFGADDFSIDFWIKPGGYNNQGDVLAQGDITSFSGTKFRLNVNSSLLKVSFYSSSTYYFVQKTLTCVAGFNHIAVCRSGGSMYLFLNGTQLTTVYSMPAADAPIDAYVGQSAYMMAKISATSRFEGYLDEMRIVKGAALFTADFTPPTAAYS